MRSPIVGLVLLAIIAAPAFAGESGYATKAVDLQETPAPGARVVAKLPKKQPLEILDRNGSWARVRAATVTGWMRTIDLRFDAAAGKIATVRVKSSTDSGIRGFSEEELLAGSPGSGELDKFKRMAISAKDASGFARAAGLKSRKQDYFEGTDYLSIDFPEDFFDE